MYLSNNINQRTFLDVLLCLRKLLCSFPKCQIWKKKIGYTLQHKHITKTYNSCQKWW